MLLKKFHDAIRFPRKRAILSSHRPSGGVIEDWGSSGEQQGRGPGVEPPPNAGESRGKRLFIRLLGRLRLAEYVPPAPLFDDNAVPFRRGATGHSNHGSGEYQESEKKFPTTHASTMGKLSGKFQRFQKFPFFPGHSDPQLIRPKRRSADFCSSKPDTSERRTMILSPWTRGRIGKSRRQSSNARP